MVEGKTVIEPSLREKLANVDCKTFEEALKDNDNVVELDVNELVETLRDVDSDSPSDMLPEVEGDKLAEADTVGETLVMTLRDVEAETLGATLLDVDAEIPGEMLKEIDDETLAEPL